MTEFRIIRRKLSTNLFEFSILATRWQANVGNLKYP